MQKFGYRILKDVKRKFQLDVHLYFGGMDRVKVLLRFSLSYLCLGDRASSCGGSEGWRGIGGQHGWRR